MAPCLWVLIQLLSVGFHKMLAIDSQFRASVFYASLCTPQGEQQGGFVFKLFTCKPKLQPPSVICLFDFKLPALICVPKAFPKYMYSFIVACTSSSCHCDVVSMSDQSRLSEQGKLVKPECKICAWTRWKCQEASASSETSALGEATKQLTERVFLQVGERWDTHMEPGFDQEQIKKNACLQTRHWWAEATLRHTAHNPSYTHVNFHASMTQRIVFLNLQLLLQLCCLAINFSLNACLESRRRK